MYTPHSALPTRTRVSWHRARAGLCRHGRLNDGVADGNQFLVSLSPNAVLSVPYQNPPKRDECEKNRQEMTMRVKSTEKETNRRLSVPVPL